MKSKMAKSLSILLSLCILGSSGAEAAEFSSGAEAVDEISETAEDSGISESSEISEVPEITEGTKNEDENFSAQEQENVFSDSESSEGFSDTEEIEEIPEAEDPGSIDTTLAARYKNAVVEAQIEADPSVKTNCKVYNASNLEFQNYSTFGARVASYLTTSSDGKLMRVQFGAIDGQALVEYYDTSYNIINTVTVPLALPDFGAFYESENNYYILTGQDNPDKNDSVEVYRVTKYSKNWKVQGSASLFGEKTKYPFNFGSARMAMDGKNLYVRTCHVMYNGHQANISFSVNTDTMSVVDILTGVRYSQEGYVSHSFNQFVQIDQGKMITLDQCDAYPARALVFLKYNTDLTSGKFAPRYNSWMPNEPNATYCSETDILKVGGTSGENYTGMSAGALEYSDSSWLVAGNFDTSDSGSARNVFVAAIPKSGGDPVVRYFTNYAGTNDSASTPHLVKTGNNSFILLWSSKGKVYYTAVDGNGQQSGQTYSMTGNLSDCVPKVINGKLVWYTWKQKVNVFYEINLSNLSSTRAVKIVNGHKDSYGKKVTNGTVSRMCTVCGENLGTIAVPVSMEPIYGKEGSNYRYMRGNVNLDPGTTYQLECGPNFTASGERLYDCEVISSDPSVVSVNMTGNTSADITAHKSGTATLTICSKYNQDATITANISVGIMDSSQYNISLSENSFVYDGTEHKPVVKLYKNGTAVDEKNYMVTYEGDMINVGTAKVIVTGTGEITGTMTKQFKITPADFSKCKVTISEDPIYFYEDKTYVPEFTVKDGEKILKEGKDFSVTYKYNDKPGNAQATFKGMGNYSSRVIDTQFYIIPRDVRNCEITLSGDSFTATGEKIEPEVIIKFGEKILQENVDFIVNYVDNIEPGTATVRIFGTGRYEGYITKTFTILKKDEKTKDISKCTVTLNETSFKYDGKEKKPSVTVKDGSTVLKEGTDYTVSYSDNIKAGTARAVITGKGKYTGTVTKTFTITAPAEESKDIAKCQVTLGKTSYVFDGTEKKPSVTVKDGSTVLKEGTDYTVSYSDNVKAGTAKVTITGKGKYTGTVTETFQIAEKFEAGDISDARVILSKDYYEYDGKEHKPTVSKLYVKGKLISEENYKVSYPKDLVNAGTPKLTIIGTGSCTGSCTATFTIAPRRFSNCTVIVPKGPFYYYEGTVYKPKYIVKDGDKTLVEGKDFTVTYQYNDKPGYTWDTLRGMGNYADDTIQKQFYIIPPSFNECSLTFENDTVIYNGHPAEPKVIMKFGEKTLKLNQDYTVMYVQNNEPGTGIAYVNGRGDYVGFKILYFTVQKKNVKMTDISKAKVTISGNAVRYDGDRVRLPKITLELNGKVLEEDKDFRTNCLSTHSATTGQLIITGKGIYSGVIEGTIHIDPENTKNDPENTKKKDISDCTIGIGGDGFTYTGSAIKPKVQVSSETEDLTEGTDYTVSYKNNVQVGTATAVVKGKGIYTGTLSITFKIRPVNTKTFTLKSGSKGKLTVSWKTAKSVSGYEIQYSRSQNMKNAQSVVIKGKTTKATLKNLAKTKKYYVRVRTYKTVKGKKYYSAWSSVKTVKVK